MQPPFAQRNVSERIAGTGADDAIIGTHKHQPAEHPDHEQVDETDEHDRRA
jgi:hypothetical protein